MTQKRGIMSQVAYTDPRVATKSFIAPVNDDVVIEVGDEAIKPSARTDQPEQIVDAKDYIARTLQELLHKANAFDELTHEFKVILEYNRALVSLLDVNAEGDLCYHTACSPIGPYSSEAKVIQCINKKVSDFKTFYETQPKQWKTLRLASQIVAGLDRIIADYPDTLFHSYESFTVELTKTRIDLDAYYQAECKKHTAALSQAIQKPDSSVYDLLNTNADMFPLVPVLDRIRKDYGDNMATHVRLHIISEEMGTSDEDRYISQEVVQGCLMAIAAHVKTEDLAWKYAQPEAESGAEFKNLNPHEVDRLLTFFRKAPNGESLFSYFDIPMESGAFGVDPKFLETLPRDTHEGQNLINEMCVLADIESARLWHPEKTFEMPELDMMSQLNSLFQDPFNTQLFHTDRYLSFLVAAATSLAYLQSFKGNAGMIRKEIPPLIALIESIEAAAPQKYPAAYANDYLSCWQGLKAQLNEAMLNPAHDVMPYYRRLFIHPHNNAKESALLKALRALQPSEFLARKIGYWHRYYLDKSANVDTDSPGDVQGCINLRKGALFHLSNGEAMVLHKVRDIDS